MNLSHILTLFTALIIHPLLSTAWLPTTSKIRGVNLGGHFIIEPWLQYAEWNSMGCADQKNEFDCVLKLGQASANTIFQKHWNTWITQADIAEIASLGLNTIRVPLGYWIKEDLVYADSEHFPQGGFFYLERLCKWASDAGLYIILELHGAPGAQNPEQPFTGQYAPTAGFYQPWQYERAYKWLEWIVETVHTNLNFTNVGAVELVNEPLQDASKTQTMINEYYPTAWKRIRAVEDRLGVTKYDRVHIQMMNEKWGSGNPNAALTDLWFAFYDDHHYVKSTPGVEGTRAGYLRHTCRDDRGGNWPVIVGEWSLSPQDENGAEFGLWVSGAKEWYRKWWAAQVVSYERQSGWVFWSWKVQLGDDWRWGYKNAVEAGVIPRDPTVAASYGACNGV